MALSYYSELKSEECEGVLKAFAEALGGKIHWADHDMDEAHRRAGIIVAKVEKDWHGEEHEVPDGLYTGPDRRSGYSATFPSKERAKAFIKIGKGVRHLISKHWEGGQVYGTALLDRLARGEITIKEFNESIKPMKGGVLPLRHRHLCLSAILRICISWRHIRSANTEHSSTPGCWYVGTSSYRRCPHISPNPEARTTTFKYYFRHRGQGPAPVIR